MLSRLRSGLAQELIDQMYFDEDTLAGSSWWREEDENKVIHRDSNGVILEVGSVVLIKDLK
jgi:protein PhnA